MKSTDREKEAADIIKKYKAGETSLTSLEIARMIAKDYAQDLNPMLAVIEPADGKMFFATAGAKGEEEGIKYEANSCIDGSMWLRVGDRSYLVDAKRLLVQLFEYQYPQFGKQTPSTKGH